LGSSRRIAIDVDLVAEANRAEERLIEVEREAETARAEFHRAIRRLQLSGAFMREIASELGLSHQRVQRSPSPPGGRPGLARRLSADTATTIADSRCKSQKLCEEISPSGSTEFGTAVIA
jgi:hypothetical protein